MKDLDNCRALNHLDFTLWLGMLLSKSDTQSSYHASGLSPDIPLSRVSNINSNALYGVDGIKALSF